MSVQRPITAPSPEISVVIPTLPSNDTATVVEYLERQTFNGFEVIVVNDADLDICEARNEGIKESNGAVVALTDDDCQPGPDWLSTIRNAFQSETDLVCLEGSVHGGRTYEGTRRYVGCNLAFDREAARTVGGFRSDYAGWRDDTEFGWRMERDASGQCGYSGRVRMHHPPVPRAKIDEDIEARLRSEYPDRYEEIIVPNSALARINDWLWRRGIWDAIDRIRYRGDYQ